MRPRIKKTLSTMTTRQMFVLWWHEPWIRYLVFSLSPIGFIDAAYTVLLVQTHGLEYEANPLVRFALSTEWWAVWFLLDVFAFSLFAMIAGSYYLHTRSRIFGNKIWWFTALIGFRVAAACYNMLLFYGLEAPLGLAILLGFISFYISGSLLSRTEDVTKEGIVSYVRRRIRNLHDWYLMRGVRRPVESMPEMAVSHPDAELGATPGETRLIHLLKRAAYISAAILVFVSTPFVLLMLADVTGAGEWSKRFGPLIFWNEVSGPAFVIGFMVIIALTAAMIYFVLKAFGVQEELL
ncbi:MAG: hypothetical protein ACTSPE_10055 [Candidatus Thorarchaeota archaeon]